MLREYRLSRSRQSRFEFLVCDIAYLSQPEYLRVVPNQVAFVWSQPWSLGTVLFVLNRYLPFVDTFISLRCPSLLV